MYVLNGLYLLLSTSLQVATPQKGARDQLSLGLKTLHWVDAKHIPLKSKGKQLRSDDVTDMDTCWYLPLSLSAGMFLVKVLGLMSTPLATLTNKARAITLDLYMVLSRFVPDKQSMVELQRLRCGF